ncbi:hypothetical protein L6452_16880 [Arctium lappa]|uniref:Uncharacterized protein n=1 Tax=Arctium lappa TaxID=4217 RepID=A0ACB9C259_ARCLA|nr:hypothetical protein L6452_16880 [Arctium lappa]
MLVDHCFQMEISLRLARKREGQEASKAASTELFGGNDFEEDEKEKDRSHRHNVERKRTKKQQLEQQSSAASVEYESGHKRYKKDHRHYDDQKETEMAKFDEVYGCFWMRI